MCPATVSPKAKSRAYESLQPDMTLKSGKESSVLLLIRDATSSFIHTHLMAWYISSRMSCSKSFPPFTPFRFLRNS